MSEPLRIAPKVRTRQVNLRLTDEEFGKLRAACVISGADSISDFARAALFRYISLAAAASASPTDQAPLSNFYRTVLRLEAACRRLEERLGHLNHENTPAE